MKSESDTRKFAKLELVKVNYKAIYCSNVWVEQIVGFEIIKTILFRIDEAQCGRQQKSANSV